MDKEDVFETLKIGYRNLWRNKLRSGLAMAAIIIGMFAVLFIFTQANVQAEQLNKQTKDNWIEISGGRGINAAENITPDRLEKIKPYVSDAEVAKFSEIYVINIKTPGMREKQRWMARWGENPSAVYPDAAVAKGSIPSNFKKGIIAPNSTAQRYKMVKMESGKMVEADSVKINGSKMGIQAIIEGRAPPSISGGGYASGPLLLPKNTRRAKNLKSVIVRANSVNDAKKIYTKINGTLNSKDQVKKYGKLKIRPGYNATNYAAQAAKKGNTALVLAAGVSVVVAALGILNVMLMNIVERRGEIGLLRAVGAGREDILTMILAEAGLLGTIGGFLGAFVALIAGTIYAVVLYDDPTLVLQMDNFMMYMGAVVLSIVVAVVSSVYPARKAANENPVEALRGK